MRIYISAPIDRAKPGTALTSFQLLRDSLVPGWPEGLGLSAFLPGFAYAYAPGQEHDAAFIIEINRLALATSDLFILIHQPGVESWGCPQELALAASLHIPILLITPERFDDLPIYLKYHCTPEMTVYSVAQAVILAARLAKEPTP